MMMMARVASGLLVVVLAVAVRDESGVPSNHCSGQDTGHISHINHSVSSSSYIRQTKHVISASASRRTASSASTNTGSICEDRVHNKLLQLTKEMGDSARVPAVLGDQSMPETFQECCKSTEYDKFMRANAKPTFDSTTYERIEKMERRDMKSSARAYSNNVFDKETALVIIDVQKDFTEGSFFQPCWSSIRQDFMSNLESAIRKAAAAGSLIVASKDFHPSNHCSFGGICSNMKDARENTSSARYQNSFPSHCTYMKDKSGYLLPQPAPETPFCKLVGGAVPFCRDSAFKGTDFEPSLAKVLRSLSKSITVEVVYKGLHESFDSFSAMHHEVDKETSHHVSEAEIQAERGATGGFALPEERARECHGKWDEKKECYPTEKQLQDRSGLRSFSSILDNHKIKKMVVVGLVYDYCVKETAIFTRENSKNGMHVTVLGHLTRPSFDGKPGAPYTAALCDGKAQEDGFCTEGGGTTKAHEKVLGDYTANGVLFERPI